MKIAILGTGTMGTGFAEGLINAGHEVIVFNRTAARTEPLVALGAKAVLTPTEAIVQSDASILVLADGNAVRETLLNETTRSALEGKKILNASTTDADEILAISNEVAALGGSLSEISILVGAEQLRDQKGNFLLGCDPSITSFWNEILTSIGTCHAVGGVGDASKAEAPMLFGSMFISMTAAYSAALALKLNVPEEVITQQLSMFVPHVEYMLPNMIARDYSQCMASVDSFKDVSTVAIRTAKSVNLPTKALEAILELYEEAGKRGFGCQDGTSVMEVLLDSKNN